MNKAKNSAGGFTLMEILVTINVSLILISMGVAFYLFALKFVGMTTKRLQERNNICTVLYNVKQKLQRSENFKFVGEGYKKYLILDEQDTIEIKNNALALIDLYKIEEIANIETKIVLADNDELVIENGKIIQQPMQFSLEEGIHNYDIAAVKILVEKNEHKYQMEYYNNYQAIKRFNNIRLKDVKQN